MKDYKVEKRRKDKADFATVDKVLDKNTMAILNKLQRRAKIFDLSGAVSSGKESNIYTARCSTSLISKFIQENADETEAIVPVVLKIYKTSTMLFKDRDRYIVDEKRFANFCTSNSRKLIKVWAEKEVRNLKRMAKYGIPCPQPLYLKKSILIMTMIGDGSPAPRLKDASVDDWGRVYEECVGLMEALYQKAGLIHADFSEYNLVYHAGRVYVIDVGQSIEKNQENSNNFLSMDIRNCNDFFRRKDVAVHNEVDVFERITGLKIPKYLKKEGRLSRETFIPSRITEVVNKEDLDLFMADAHEGESHELASSDEHEPVSSDEHELVSSDSTGLPPKTDEYKDQSIDILLRRLRLRYPEMTKEEEKEINRKRKQIVKEMNKERRITRASKSEKMKAHKKRRP